MKGKKITSMLLVIFMLATISPLNAFAAINSDPTIDSAVITAENGVVTIKGTTTEKHDLSSVYGILMPTIIFNGQQAEGGLEGEYGINAATGWSIAKTDALRLLIDDTTSGIPGEMAYFGSDIPDTCPVNDGGTPDDPSDDYFYIPISAVVEGITSAEVAKGIQDFEIQMTGNLQAAAGYGLTEYTLLLIDGGKNNSAEVYMGTAAVDATGNTVLTPMGAPAISAVPATGNDSGLTATITPDGTDHASVDHYKIEVIDAADVVVKTVDNIAPETTTSDAINVDIPLDVTNSPNFDGATAYTLKVTAVAQAASGLGDATANSLPATPAKIQLAKPATPTADGAGIGTTTVELAQQTIPDGVEVHASTDGATYSKITDWTVTGLTENTAFSITIKFVPAAGNEKYYIESAPSEAFADKTAQTPTWEITSTLSGDNTITTQTYGYATGNSVVSTITNNGNQPVTLSATATDSNFEITVADTGEIAAGDSTTVTVKAKEGLGFGDYTKAITVTATGVGANTGQTDTKSFNVAYHVDKAQLTWTNAGLTGTNKEYDGTADGDFTGTPTLGGLATGDTQGTEVTVAIKSGAKGTFASSGVDNGINMTVEVADFDFGGTKIGNYEKPTGTLTLTANITKKALTIKESVTATKDYDGTKVVEDGEVTGLELDGIVGTENVTLAAGTTFEAGGINAGTQYTLTVNNLALDGTDKGNYSIPASFTTAGNVVTVNTIEMTLTNGNLAVTEKAYDGTNKAEITGLPEATGLAATDSLAAGELEFAWNGAAESTFADGTVGNNKNVTIASSKFILNGTKALNYTVKAADLTLQGNIIQATPTGLTGTANAIIGQKPSDLINSITHAIQGITADGTLAGGFVLKGGEDDTAFVADGDVTRTYTFTPANTSYKAADVTVTITVAPKPVPDVVITPNGNLTYNKSPKPVSVTVKVGGVDVDSSKYEVQYTVKDANDYKTDVPVNAGAYTAKVVMTDAAYDQPTTTADFTIAQKGLTWTADGLTITDKTYDGTTNAPFTGNVTITDGVETGDTFVMTAIGSSAGTFNSADVNEASTVTINKDQFTLSGTGYANYTLTNATADKAATISQAQLTWTNGTLAGTNKVYDGTADGDFTGDPALGGLATGETQGTEVTVAIKAGAKGTFASSDVADGINLTVEASDFDFGGDKIDNYAQPVGMLTLTANITAATIDAPVAPTGTAQYGQKLTAPTEITASTGTLTGLAAGTDYTIKWYRADDATGVTGKTELTTGVSGTNNEEYTVAAEAVDKYIFIEVTGQGNYTTTPVMGARTAQVAKQDISGTISVTGTMNEVNHELSVDLSQMVPANGTGAGLTYEWFRADAATGAPGTSLGTNATYTTTGDDLDKYIYVTVTAASPYTGAITSDRVGIGDIPNYVMQLSGADLTGGAVAFDNEEYGYTQPPAKDVTVTNGNRATDIEAALSGTDAASFAITAGGTASTVGAAGTTIVSVQPNANLPYKEGGYTATVTVTSKVGADIKDTKTFIVNFTVDKQQLTAPGVPTAKVIGHDSIELNAITPPTGAKVQYAVSPDYTYQDSPVFTDLTPNTAYTFKAKFVATDTNYADSNETQSASISTTVAPSYLLSATPTAAFGNITYGDGLPGAITITVTNDGNQVLNNVNVTPKSGDTANFTVTSAMTDIAVGMNATFTIQPKDNLGWKDGGYSAVFTVSADNVTGNADVTATLTVDKKTLDAPAVPTVQPENIGAVQITLDTITPAANSEVNYAIKSIGGTAVTDLVWQAETTFDGLSPDTSYTFVAKAVPQNTNYAASAESAESAVITTLNTPVYQMALKGGEGADKVVFDQATYGYAAAPAAQNITVSNTGNMPLAITAVPQGNTEAFDVTGLDQTGDTAANTDKTYSVQPKLGLAAGKYELTLTLTGTNGANEVTGSPMVVTVSYTIAPIQLTWTEGALEGVNKVYDRTADVKVKDETDMTGFVTGFLPADAAATVKLKADAAGSYLDSAADAADAANAGENKKVSFGKDQFVVSSANYVLADNITVTGTITQAEIDTPAAPSGDTTTGSTLTIAELTANDKALDKLVKEVEYKVQWFRSSTADGEGSEIAGETNKSYTLTSSDVNYYIYYKVSGVGNFAEGPYPSGKVGPARNPSNPSRPSGGNGGGGGGSTYVSAKYEVTFYPGTKGNITAGQDIQQISKNMKVTAVPTVTASEGFLFRGWTIDGTNTVDPKTVAITKDTTFMALYEQAGEHTPYIVGRDASSFDPEGTLTRAEAVAMLTRNDSGFDNQAHENTFSDMNSSMWSYNNVTYGAEAGIVQGFPDGTFKPDQSVTRAEFTAMVARFSGISEIQRESRFSDCGDTFAKGYITALKNRGIIDGFPDGTFRPEQTITRAEAVKLVNGVLGRTPDSTKIQANEGQVNNPFQDVAKDHWAYYEILEAALQHSISIFH